MKDKWTVIWIAMWISFLAGTQLKQGPNTALLLIFGISSIAFSVWIENK
ncbi:hypothetical protein [Pectinatus frisingensis]|nr:hypothetical protein [Pectinatus frisingensis]